MQIRQAHRVDVSEIHRLAHETWWVAYKNVISKRQISFMLDDMYSEAALLEQFDSEIEFLIAEKDDVACGFAAFSSSDSIILRIHKLYILPSAQGKGAGKMLLDYLSNIALHRGLIRLELNVNRANPSLDFYKKYGFKISDKVDIPYYQFILKDYILRKDIRISRH